MDGARFRQGGRRTDADGRAGRRMVVRRPRRRIRRGQAGAGRELRHRRPCPSRDGNAHDDGLLAERQVLFARLRAKHRVFGAGAGALCRCRPGRSGVHRRVLRRRLRRQGNGLSHHGDPGIPVEDGQPAGDDADRTQRGVRHRPRSAGLPGAGQDRPPRGWPHHRGRPVYRPRQRSDDGTRRLAGGRLGRIDGLSAAGDALARRTGTDQHAAARLSARSRRKPDRQHHRADPRQGGG